MKIDIADKEKGIKQISIEVPWEDFSADYENYLIDFQKNLVLNGFRKGKIPTKIVKRRFGRELRADFANELIKKYYMKVIDEYKLKPVNVGKVSELKFEEGQPLSFKVSLEVEPEFELFDYTAGFEVTKNIYEPSGEDVDLTLEELRERNAEVVTVESGAEEGHDLLVDIQEMDKSGIPIVGKKFENRYIKLGEGPWTENALEKLKGALPGEEREVEIKSPSDPGLSTFYRIKIHRVEEHKKPPLNDDFARSVDDRSENMEQLRERIMENINRRLEYDSEREFVHSLADALIRNTEIEIPESMINNYLNNVIEKIKNSSEKEVDKSMIRKNYMAEAVWNIKWMLIKEKIVEQENIAVTPKEVNDRIREISSTSSSDSPGEELKGYSSEYRERVKNDILEEKVLALLKNYARVKEKKVKTSELRKKRLTE